MNKDKIKSICCHRGAPWCFCGIEVVSLILLAVASLLILILVPLSFAYVEWDEIAFKKNQYTNSVDKDKIYTNGRYNWGIAYNTPLTFPAQYVNIVFSELLVFSKNGLEFAIQCSLQYKLPRNASDLKQLYDEYNTNYHDQISNMAKATIKRVVPKYSVQDYSLKREQIARDINSALTVDGKKIWIDIPNFKFQLLQITFPDDIKSKFLSNAIQIQKNEKAKFEQEADVIRKETETLVSEVQANITRINASAEAQSKQIVVSANALSFTIVTSAESEGIDNLFETLNVTTTSVKEKYLQLFAILDNDNSKLVVGDISALINA